MDGLGARSHAFAGDDRFVAADQVDELQTLFVNTARDRILDGEGGGMTDVRFPGTGYTHNAVEAVLAYPLIDVEIGLVRLGTYPMRIGRSNMMVDR